MNITTNFFRGETPGRRQPLFDLVERLFMLFFNHLKVISKAVPGYFSRGPRWVYHRLTRKSEPVPRNFLDSATFIRSDTTISTTAALGQAVVGGIGNVVRHGCGGMNGLYAGPKRGIEEMARVKNRTTISLTESEVQALEQLREHFDAQSVSETIRRSLSQSSLLKRFSDANGDTIVERDGKRYVIPAPRG